jgi:hypothetical protein
MASLRNFSMVSALLFVVPVAALAAGCTVEKDPPPPSGPVYTYPSEAAFCDAIAAAECTNEVVNACFGSDAATLEADRKSCIAARKDPTRCNPSSFQYHPEHADPCVDSRKAIYADAELTKAEIESDYEVCLKVFSRGGAVDSNCSVDIDCDTAVDLRCVIKGTDPVGTCVEPVEAMGGQKCTAADVVCADGFYCDNTNCLERPAEGETCSALILCKDGLKCDTTTTKCVTKLGNGETCNADDDCQGYCNLNSDGISGTCAAKVILAISSQTCDAFQPQ